MSVACFVTLCGFTDGRDFDVTARFIITDIPETMHQLPLHCGNILWDLSGYYQCCPVLKGKHGLGAIPFYNFTLWILLGFLTFPSCVQCLIFKVGVLGPWSCDPMHYKSLPSAAARLAVNRINEDFTLDMGCKLDFVLLQQPCETSKALTSFVNYETLVDAFVGPANPGYCAPAALLARNWNKAMFSWACVNYELDRAEGYPTFARALPSPARVLFTVLKYFRWANIGVVSSDEDIWIDTAGKLASSLRNQGLPVGLVASVGSSEEEMRSALKDIQNAGDMKGRPKCFDCLFV